MSYPPSSVSDYDLWMYERLRDHIKNAAKERTRNVNHYTPSNLDVYILGLTIVIGGQYFGWNFGLEVGFGGALISLLFIGGLYISLCLCQAEICSAVPFAGGAYGLARIALGEYLGFMAGACEALEYISYVACSFASLSMFMRTLLHIEENIEMVEIFFTLLWYTISLVIIIFGGKYFWFFSTGIGILSTLIVFLYFFCALSQVNFAENAGTSSEEMFIGGLSLWITKLPLSAWWYVGIEAVGFAADEVEKPKETIPRGIVLGVSTLFCTSMMVLWSSCSSPPGTATLAIDAAPLTYVFSHSFGITVELATIFYLPAVFATAFGFMYPAGKLIHSLSMSRLLPSFLSSLSHTGAPWAAQLSGSTLSFLLAMYIHFRPLLLHDLFNICMLFAFYVYILQCVGYLQLQGSFSSVDREFRSPLGVYGAYYCIFACLVNVLSLVAFQVDQTPLVVCVLVNFTLSIYYFTVVENEQKLSMEEERAHLVLLIIKYRQHVNDSKRDESKGLSSNASSHYHESSDGLSSGGKDPNSYLAEFASKSPLQILEVEVGEKK